MNKIRCYSLFPNLLTLINLALGFSSILYAIKGEYTKSVLLIAAAVFVDAIDGFIARKFCVESRFGLELDSLCDFLSFCVSPAILFYLMYDIRCWFVLLLLPVCGALRLARFNITGQQEYFIGLPSPAAGGFLASITLIKSLDVNYAVVLLVLSSILMVSNLRYKTFKSIINGLHLNSFLLVLAAAFLPLFDIRLLLAPFLTYLIVGLKLGKK